MSSESELGDPTAMQTQSADSQTQSATSQPQTDLEAAEERILNQLAGALSQMTAANDALTARVSTLERFSNFAQTRIGELTSSNENRELEIVRLAATLANVRAAVVGGTVGSRVRAAPPARYDGKDKKLGERFLDAVEGYATLAPFADDTQRIQFAHGYLDGDAYAWSKVRMAATPSNALTWAMYRAEFDVRFCERNRPEAAMLELQKLTQGSRSMEVYVTEFQSLQQQLLPTEHDSSWVIERFRRGLTPKMLERLSLLTWTTVAEAVAQFRLKEQVWAEIDERTKSFAGASKPAAAAPRQYNPPAYHPPAPTAAVVSNPPAPRDPNAMDVDRARASGACFKCGEIGHISRYCKNGLMMMVKKLLAEERASEEGKKAAAAPKAAAAGPDFV